MAKNKIKYKIVKRKLVKPASCGNPLFELFGLSDYSIFSAYYEPPRHYTKPQLVRIK